MCRSAKRSASAAEVATKAGWVNAFNVLEGFEGELDDHEHRGTVAGWRLRGLPWVQD
jgi:rhodanese-related sulfurtransferase